LEEVHEKKTGTANSTGRIFFNKMFSIAFILSCQIYRVNIMPVLSKKPVY